MYIEDVQQYFLNKQGKCLCISPADYMLIDKWEKDGIPLDIIYKGIDKTFKNFGNANKDKVTSIYKCKNEIFLCWEEYKRNCRELRFQKIVNKPKEYESSKEVLATVLTIGCLSFL